MFRLPPPHTPLYTALWIWRLLDLHISTCKAQPKPLTRVRTLPFKATRDWACVVCVCAMRAHSTEEHRRIDSIVFWKLAENCYGTVFRKLTVSTSAARYREKKKNFFGCCVCACVSGVEKIESWTSLCVLLLTRLNKQNIKNCGGAVVKAPFACLLAKGRKPGIGLKSSFSSALILSRECSSDVFGSVREPLTGSISRSIPTNSILPLC